MAIAFAGFIGAVVLLADTRHLGFLYAVYEFPYGDKAGHVLLYGVLTLLADLALFELLPGRERRRVALACGVSVALLASLEELSQLWFPSRTPSWFDLLASYAGVGLFSWIAMHVPRFEVRVTRRG